MRWYKGKSKRILQSNFLYKLMCHLQILRHEKIPTLICNDCYGFLKVSYKFRTICRNSNEYLKEFVVKGKISPLTVETPAKENPLSLAENDNNGKVNKRMPYKRRQKEKDTTATVTQIIKIEKDEERLNTPVNTIEPEQHLKDDEFEAIIEDEVDDDMWFDNDVDDDENFEISIEALDLDIKEEEEADEDIEKAKKPKRKRKSTTEKTKKTNKKPTKTLAISSDGTAVIRERKPRAKKEKAEKQPHICDVCGNIYQRRYALELHMRRHRDEKPFDCE